MNFHSPHRLYCSLVVTLMLNGAADAASLANPVIHKSAEQAQQRCYAYLHDDPKQYRSCLDGMLSAVKGKSETAALQRIGIVYFGWVGANSAARMSMPGAEAAAHAYLPRVRKLQKALRLTDETLCASVDGDCRTRLAQMAQMEAELAGK